MRMIRVVRSARGVAFLLLVTLVLPLSCAQGAEYWTNWVPEYLSNYPSQRGVADDPDNDGVPNLVEYALGTSPITSGDGKGCVRPVFGGTNGSFGVEVLEKAGHRPGVQMHLKLSSNFTNWIEPWWQVSVTNSRSSDPTNSVRELYATRLPGTNRWFARCGAELVDPGPVTAAYYVATNGSDSNAGTSTNAPFLTLGKAVGLANPGNLIYIRGGTYRSSSKISLSRSGTPPQPISVRPYPGEAVLFDFSGEATGTDGFSVSGNCWDFCGIETTNAGHNGINISGASNIIERCVVHASRNTGIHITGTTNTGYNLVLNCDSYMNYDAATHGQNADGFSAKWVIGLGNVFRGCRSWLNADDGWDLWMATNSVTIENCWAFNMGFNIFGDTAWEGNGNGFKLGGSYVAAPHRLIHCLSFLNAANGVDQNNNIAGQTLDNNTVWANYGANYSMKHGTNTTPHVIRNNISMAGKSSDSFTTGTLATNNSWQVFSAGVVTNDFLSINTNFALLPRKDNGDLPESPFLRPVPGGRLVDAGVKNGQSYSGTAPDLGAYETLVW